MRMAMRIALIPPYICMAFFHAHGAVRIGVGGGGAYGADYGWTGVWHPSDLFMWMVGGQFCAQRFFKSRGKGQAHGASR